MGKGLTDATVTPEDFAVDIDVAYIKDHGFDVKYTGKSFQENEVYAEVVMTDRRKSLIPMDILQARFPDEVHYS